MIGFVLFAPVQANGQSKVDSLETLLKNHPERDTSRVRILHQLSYAVYASQPKRTESAAQEAIEICDSLNENSLLARSWYFMSLAKIIQGDLESAKSASKTSLRIHGEEQDSAAMLPALNILGSVFGNEGKLDSAQQNYLLALRVSEKNNDTLSMATANINVGMIFYFQKQYEKALEYYEKGYDYGEIVGVPGIQANAANNIGAAYLDMDSLERALPYFLESEKIKMESGNEHGLAVTLVNIGEIYTKMGEYEKAEGYLRRSLASAKITGSPIAIASSYRFLGRMHWGENRMDSAAYYYTLSIEMLEEAGGTENLRHVYFEVSEVYEKRNEYQKAYSALKKYTQINDSILGVEQTEQLARLQTQYETEKQDLEMLRLEEVQAAQSETIKRQNLIGWLVGIGFVLALVAGGFLLWGYLRIRKQRQELEKKNAEIEEARSRLEVQNRLLEQASREQDSVLGIVAHDLRSPLGKVKGLADLVSVSGPVTPEQKNLLEMIQRVSDNGTSLIRDLLEVTSAENLPKNLEKTVFNLKDLLIEAVRGHQTAADKKKIELILKAEASLRIESDRESISRILDNLLSNALKFSEHGTQVSLGSKEYKNSFEIWVKDQGPGLSREDQQKMFRKFQKLSARPTGGESSHGLGLSIIKTLTEKLNGKIEVESEPGKGSTFILTFPK